MRAIQWDAGRGSLIVSNGWKYFAVNYGRKGGKMEADTDTCVVLVSGNKRAATGSRSVASLQPR